MTQSVTLPSTLASPSRVFLSPFPPPSVNNKADTTSMISPTSPKHSICPYHVSTDLAKTYDIYNRQSSSLAIVTAHTTKQNGSPVKSYEDAFPLDQYLDSTASTISSSDGGEDDDLVSLYYYQRNTNDSLSIPLSERVRSKQCQPPLVTSSSSLSSFASSVSSSTSISSSTATSSSSLSSSLAPSYFRLRASVSTPLLKSRQSSPVPSSSTRMPRWIKHVSQTPGLLEKKLSRGFPFRCPSPIPVPLHMADRQPHKENQTIITTPSSKALYRGSPLVRQYLKSVTRPHHWDDMLKYGFPCPHSMRLDQVPAENIHSDDNHDIASIFSHDGDGDDLTTKAASSRSDNVNERCKKACHQCGGQQRLMTLRVTLTPQHARANENEIYKKKRKTKYTSKLVTPSSSTSTSTLLLSCSL